MSSSAINAQLFQAKIGSIQNQADSSSVYSAGVWSFKNSTALTSVTITDAGNVGIGTASPAQKLAVVGTTRIARPADTTQYLELYSSGGEGFIDAVNSAAGTNQPIIFRSGNNSSTTERMRIDASGSLLVGCTSPGNSQVGFNVYFPSSNTPAPFNVVDTTGAANSWHFYNMSATNNGYRFYVKIDGGIVNYAANNSNLSDERVKTDISLASSYLEKICAIPVKTFRYKDQGDDTELTLGVIAQDVEKIAPELVNTTDGFGDLPEDGIPLKTVYQTDLQYALMKCIQELKEKNDALEARLAALESK